MPDDMSEFEVQLGDIVDPSPFNAAGMTSANGERILTLFSELLNLLSEDAAEAFNLTGVPLMQYMVPRTGVSITVAIPYSRIMEIRVQLTPEVGEFITVVERDGDDSV